MKDKDLIEKVLGDPAKYPSALSSWIQRYISGNKLIQINEAQLPDAERVHLFGAAGQPVYLNSWVNSGGSSRTGGYYRDPVSRGYLFGVVAGGIAARRSPSSPPATGRR
jgi:hypothetical protein